jgi:predicted phage terminase large subunit-like protein
LTPEEQSIAYDRKLVERFGLLAFGVLAWPIVEPAAKYVHGWHIEEICSHVEACYTGRLPKMLINVPPGMGKSLWCSVFADAWAWSWNPGFKTINTSFDDTLVQRDGTKFLTLVSSKWYQDRWPGARLTKTSPKTKEIYTMAGGLRYSTSVHGKGTGRHADVIKFDDPIKPADTMGAASTTKLEIDYVNNIFWDATMSTRVANPHNPRYLGIMQRLHEDDLVGHLLRTSNPTHLYLPMRFEPGRKCVTPIGGDRRAIEGDLLFPQRFPEAYVSDLERTLGIYARAQLQQDPCDPDGTVFKLVNMRRWKELPKLTSMILSGDMTFKKTAGSDLVSLQIWGTDGRDFYLVDNVTGLMGFEDTVRNTKAVLARFPNVGAKLIEDTANGPSVIETLQRTIPGIIAVTPEGGKIARANSTSYLWEAGNVYLPLDDYAPWVPLYVAELLAFPRGRHDDQVDATTQALIYLAKNLASIWAWLDQETKDAGAFQMPQAKDPWYGM